MPGAEAGVEPRLPMGDILGSHETAQERGPVRLQC
jgi:hypothetical protein